METCECPFTGNWTAEPLHGADRRWRTACIWSVHQSYPRASRAQVAVALGVTKAVVLHALYEGIGREPRYLDEVGPAGAYWRTRFLRMEMRRQTVRSLDAFILMAAEIWDGMTERQVAQVYRSLKAITPVEPVAAA